MQSLFSAAAIGALFIATSSTAETSLLDFMEGLNGEEITASGRIGYFYGESAGPSFKIDDGPYMMVDFALGRERLLDLGTCVEERGEDGCPIAANAEVRMASDRVTLLVYEFTISD